MLAQELNVQENSLLLFTVSNQKLDGGKAWERD